MVSEIFGENWNFGENIKNDKLQEIIWENIKKIMKLLKKPEINQSNQKDDMNHGIDYHLNWDIPLAFRGRRVDYDKYIKQGGSFTLRETGEHGGKAEIYKMINGEYKAEIYIFVWSCGSYAVINIKKWIKSGLLQKKLEGFKFKNKNPYNKFISFTYKELNKNNCIISFYNSKQNKLDKWF